MDDQRKGKGHFMDTEIRMLVELYTHKKTLSAKWSSVIRDLLKKQVTGNLIN